MARIDQHTSLPTYSYRSLDGKATGPKKTRLIKNILTILLVGFLLMFVFVKYSNISYSSIPGILSLFKKSSSSMETTPQFNNFPLTTGEKEKIVPSTPNKPIAPSKPIYDDKPKQSPVSSPEKYKTGSPLDAFLSGFVDPSIAAQMIKFLASQMVDPVVSTLAPVLDTILPAERINLILRTTDSITSGELSGFEAIRRNISSILESFILLLLNLAPDFGKVLVDDIVSFCDLLSDWMGHADLSIAKYLGQIVAYGILPFVGYSSSSLDQAARIFENGFSQLLPDISLLDSSVFKSKERLLSLVPSVSKIQPVIMSIFVQLASLKALQASVSSFSGSKKKEDNESSSTATTTTSSQAGSSTSQSPSKPTEHRRSSTKGKSSRRRRKDNYSDSEDSYFDN